nr:hypothetical protein Iba_chr15aCG10820 [Ipomoea batatas]
MMQRWNIMENHLDGPGQAGKLPFKNGRVCVTRPDLAIWDGNTYVPTRQASSYQRSRSEKLADDSWRIR